MSRSSKKEIGVHIYYRRANARALDDESISFAQDFFPPEKPEKKLYGGKSGIRHEELKAHNAGASPLGRV